MSFYSLTLGGGGGSGTVTSVSWTGGIVSIATATTTPAFTIAGTSGGIVYFDSATTWASSGVLTANALIKGGGAGVAPSSVTTGTGVLTALGVNTGSAGAFVVNGGDLGTPSAGVVTNLTGTASININGTVGATTANTGTFSSTVHKGATSGTITIAAPSVAGTQSYTLPTGVPAANGYALTSTTGGVMSWSAITASAGGSNTQVQYNSGGALAGSANFIFNTGYGAFVKGANASPASGNGNLRIGITDAPTVNYGGMLGLYTNITAQNDFIAFQLKGATENIGTYATYGGFYTVTTAGVLAEACRINSSQQLLVNYTSSNGAYALQVNSQIFATSAVIATSDARYKKDVTSIVNGLDLVNKLNPVSFNWKPHQVHNFDTNNIDVGFIAQEVQSTLADSPYLSNIVKSNETTLPDGTKEDFLGIADGKLIPILVKAIQELTARLEALEAK